MGGGWLLLIQSAPQKRHKPADNGGIRRMGFFSILDEWLNYNHSQQSLSGKVALHPDRKNSATKLPS